MQVECAVACKGKEAAEVEKALQLDCGMTRSNPKREFCKLEPERVSAVVQGLKVDDITQQFEQTIELDIPSADKQSAQALKRSMRPPMNFHELGIPNGSILISKDGEHQCTVVGEKKVDYCGTVSSPVSYTHLATC